MQDLGMLITLSRRHVWMAASRRLEANGYSLMSWALAGYLVKSGPATQRDIAAAIGQHPAGVSRLIDEMEAKALVRRRRDESDRRRARIEVTASGRALFKAAHPLVIGSQREALSALALDEQRQLRKLLQKLLSTSSAVDCEKAADREPAANGARGASAANGARAATKATRARAITKARANREAGATNGARAATKATKARAASRPGAAGKAPRKSV